MICIVCHKHATFDHTVFQGTSAVKVTLCPECATTTGAKGHIETIKSAGHGDAKRAAVTAFLKAVGRG